MSRDAFTLRCGLRNGSLRSFAFTQGMLLREVHGEALALQRGQTASTSGGGSGGGSGDQVQQQQRSVLLLRSSSSITESVTLSSPLLLRQKAASPSFSSDEQQQREKGSSSSDGIEGPNRPEPGLKVAKRFTLESSEASVGSSEGRALVGLGHSSSPSPLPAGWEATSDDAGNEFFFNFETGESRWEPPPSPEAPETLIDPPEGTIVRPRPSSSPSPLPAGWEAASDDAGNEFFFNVETGESRWDRPPPAGSGGGENSTGGREASGGDVGQEPRDARQGEQANTTIAGDGLGGQEDGDGGLDASSAWEEFKTGDGAPFWYNASTGESSWVFPGDPTE